MDNEEITKKGKSEAMSILASLPIEIRWVIGGLLIFFLFFSGMQFIANKGNFSIQDCWRLEYHDGRMFKFNSCNGELVEIDPEILKKI